MTRLALVLAAFSSGAAFGGSIRYDLPNLLGEHVYDNDRVFVFANQQIDTPFGYYQVEEARLVVVGRVSSGQARGDGVLREGVEFELLPRVSAVPSFTRTATLIVDPTPETFRLETIYPDPFVPQTTPLPNPGGDPPLSFSVSLTISSAFGTEYPPLLVETPSDAYLLGGGVVVETPIVAQIEQAYIVFSGASIVPEPGGTALLYGALLALAGATNRTRRQ